MAQEEFNKLSINENLEKYFFPAEEIKRVRFDDKNLDSYIQKGIPIVITDSNLVKTAIDKWNLNYLKDHLKKSTYNVFRSKTNQFLYWDDKKLNDIKNFVKPTESLSLNFGEFVDIIETWSEDDEYKYYLQQQLNDSVDQQIMDDFLKFNWKWITERKKNALWGDLTSNLLLISQQGNVTPCHYDEQENFFAQVSGQKRCILFSPSMFKYLYPYPIYHPCDRQSSINLKKPNFDLYPELKNLKSYETVVSPGDVLYIPSYWFHQIESLSTKTVIISINFWFKAKSVDPSLIEYPLSADRKVAMMRNVEKMIVQVLKNNDEVPEFFQTLTYGRYTNKPT